MVEERFDVIVVGAGPAGISAAYTLARAGLKVIVLERGEYPGAKNVMGGVLYREPTERVIPQFWKEAPLERPIVEQRLWILSRDSVFSVGVKSERFAQEPYNNFTVLRARFDRWFAKKAQEEGALLITETVGEEPLVHNGRVVGVCTGRDQGEIYADVVIAADGANSLLSKKLGFHPEIPPDQIAVVVKEIISLPADKIESRFNLEPGQGTTIELVGEATKGMVGIGFLYTNKDSLSIGVGAMVSDFARTGITPHDLIEELKSHSAIRPLLEGIAHAPRRTTSHENWVIFKGERRKILLRELHEDKWDIVRGRIKRLFEHKVWTDPSPEIDNNLKVNNETHVREFLKQRELTANWILGGSGA